MLLWVLWIWVILVCCREKDAYDLHNHFNYWKNNLESLKDVMIPMISLYEIWSCDIISPGVDTKMENKEYFQSQLKVYSLLCTLFSVFEAYQAYRWLSVQVLTQPFAHPPFQLPLNRGLFCFVLFISTFS